MKRFLIKTHNTESRYVIRPENILFAGICVHFFNPEVLHAGAVKGLKERRK